MEKNSKVSASHLKRTSYLYVRQSTVRQVFENTESTKRQYALKQKAIALGWPQERIEVIDTDLGQSATSAVDREGFQNKKSPIYNSDKINESQDASLRVEMGNIKCN